MKIMRMKNWKLWFAIVIPSLLAGIGGIFFESNTANYNKNVFLFVTGTVLILGIISFPWWKRPWKKYKGEAFTNYAGIHTFSWSFIWLSGLCIMVWYMDPVQNLYYFFSSFIYLGTGISMLILNYKGKWKM